MILHSQTRLHRNCSLWSHTPGSDDKGVNTFPCTWCDYEAGGNMEYRIVGSQGDRDERDIRGMLEITQCRFNGVSNEKSWSNLLHSIHSWKVVHWAC